MSSNRSFRMPIKLPTKARKGLVSPERRPASASTSTAHFRAPVAIRSSKRKDESSSKLMELDNTLLNAVDLDSIEKQIEQTMARISPSAAAAAAAGPSTRGTTGANQSTRSFHKRSHSLGAIESKVLASTPKRRKSSASGRQIYVLQMSMDGMVPSDEEGDSGCNEPQPSSSHHLSANGQVECEREQAERPQWSGISNDDDGDEFLRETLLPCWQDANSEALDTGDIIRSKMRRLSCTTGGVTRVTDQLRQENGFEVYTNRDICSQYLRLEQSLVDEGEEKIDAIGASQAVPERPSQLQQIATGDGSQQRQVSSELQRVFANCERTLLDMTNIEAVGAEGASQPLRASNCTLAAINWDEEIQQTVRAPDANQNNPRVSSLFLEKGPFFGLPNAVRRILRDFRGIGELYDWQHECLSLPAIAERRNLIYALPTSGGKTLVAEILMLREIICRLRNVMFIVPYVSLAQEKVIALSPFSIELQFLLEEYTGGKGQCPPRRRRKKNTIFVCTIEKSLLLMDSLIEAGRANEIGLIVIDELHMIGEQRRGACLEMLITKVQALRAGIQIVGMSATIGNLTEVARFMLADVYCRDFRPVELKEYVKCGDDLYEVRGQAQRTEEVFGEKRRLQFDYTDELRRLDQDHVVGLIMEVIPEGSCLVFCPTKSKCESLCALLANHLPASFAEHRAAEKEQIIKSLQDDGSIAAILPQSFRVGVAYHHAGLTQDERRTIEDAFRAGILSLIVCTSTLAAGVNLPAKRVIIRSPYIGTSFMTLSRYKQMVGRAGRAGFGETGDAILICAQRDIPQVCDMLCSPMDTAESSLVDADRACFKSLVLSSIGLDLCVTRDALQALVGSTLLAQQAARLGIDLEAITDETIVQLYQGNAIKATHDSCVRNPPNMVVEISSGAAGDTGQETPKSPYQTSVPGDRPFVRVHKAASLPGKLIKTIDRTSPLEVNRLGKAAIRAGFDMEKAVRYYDEMQTLGQRFCVLDEYDLFYLILLEDGREVHFKLDELIILVRAQSQALQTP
uniref:DNA polymerase theta n=1 Tax=Anopheles atroparvus TaxID=41427 RepID=A0AAG5DNE5_ANOAO